MEQITLYYRHGGSDKIYQARIEPKDAGYVVNFAYGRRGATLQTGTKTAAAVDYDAAKAIYNKLVNEKTAKGCTPGEDGTPYQHTDKTTTGIQCQLLNPVDEDQAEQLLDDPNYWMQEKMDGRRLLIRKQGSAASD
jgi:bifunctional non-homologous end joining protein LigD